MARILPYLVRIRRSGNDMTLTEAIRLFGSMETWCMSSCFSMSDWTSDWHRKWNTNGAGGVKMHEFRFRFRHREAAVLFELTHGT